MELWNKSDISMPPNSSVKMKKEDIDVIRLKSILNGALKALEEQHLLHTEAAFLSRFLFKLQRKLRGQKGIMYMHKVNRGLKRYLFLDLQYVYQNFCKTVQDVNDEYVYVPTKQMLQYVLVRTQGFCKIMNYLSVACQHAAHYFRGILQMNHCIRYCLISLSLVSRIWFCTRYFIICACQWYDQLLPYLEKLKTKGPFWLPAEYKFPETLGTWFESNPITGELKYDIDVLKISEDISQIEGFKDLGVLVRRQDYVASRSQKTNNPLGESLTMSFLNQKGKLTTDMNAESMLNNMNLSSALGVKSIENRAEDFIEQEEEIKSFLVTKNASNSMSLHNDFGEQISRDQFRAQKTKKKSLSTTSCEDPKDISVISVCHNQKLLLGMDKNDISESYSFINGAISKEENNSQLKKELLLPLKLNKLKSPTFKIVSGENIPNEGMQTNKYLSSKTLTDTFCSLDTSHGKEKKLVCKDNNDLKEVDVDMNVKNVGTSLNGTQIENQLVRSIQSSITLNDYKRIACELEFESNAERISDVNECKQECAINSAFKKKKTKKSGNWEIINGIRNFKDVKEFLLREKKARTKGKGCVTSQLNHSEWVVLFESINKHLKKKKVLKLKGKRLKPIMEEIRNTLISFVI